MTWPSCPLCPNQTDQSGFHVSDVLSRSCFHGCPSMIIPSRLSKPSCPVLDIMFWLPCPFFPVLVYVILIFFFFSSPRCPLPAVLAVLLQHSCPQALSLLSCSCSHRPVLSVLAWMPCPWCPISTTLHRLPSLLFCPSCPEFPCTADQKNE
jgi:hypothetical protein